MASTESFHGRVGSRCEAKLQHQQPPGILRSQQKKSDGQNLTWDNGVVMFKRLGFKTMSPPEGKWVRHPQPAWNTQKWPVARRVRDSGQRNGIMERKQRVVVPSDDSCSWISHRKHGRWKAEGHAAQILDEKMTYRVTTRYHDAFPKDCEMSNENW